MKNSSHIDRRHFVKLGTLAASAALVSNSSRAAETAAAAAAPYSLPPLPYATDALEPHIDAKTMEIHHGKHHQAYINNLNTALASASQKVAGNPLPTLLAELSSVADETLRATIRNNGGGHWNHEFFWNSLAPMNSRKPSPPPPRRTSAPAGHGWSPTRASSRSSTRRTRTTRS
jgi:Fe-Mn family superoxide dismutase